VQIINRRTVSIDWKWKIADMVEKKDYPGICSRKKIRSLSHDAPSFVRCVPDSVG